MTDHKTAHHPVIREGLVFHCTSCDTCHWTHATPHPEEAVQAATNHERENRYFEFDYSSPRSMML